MLSLAQLALVFRYVNDLHSLVNCYHSVMDSLSEVKFVMLSKQIKEIRKVMHSGCQRLNWNSLGMVLAASKMFV